MSASTKKTALSIDLTKFGDEIVERVDLKILPLSQAIVEINANLESTTKNINALKANDQN